MAEENKLGDPCCWAEKKEIERVLGKCVSRRKTEQSLINWWNQGVGKICIAEGCLAAIIKQGKSQRISLQNKRC